jgi:hypothetical protein
MCQHSINVLLLPLCMCLCACSHVVGVLHTHYSSHAADLPGARCQPTLISAAPAACVGRSVYTVLFAVTWLACCTRTTAATQQTCLAASSIRRQWGWCAGWCAACTATRCAPVASCSRGLKFRVGVGVDIIMLCYCFCALSLAWLCGVQGGVPSALPQGAPQFLSQTHAMP